MCQEMPIVMDDDERRTGTRTLEQEQQHQEAPPVLHTRTSRYAARHPLGRTYHQGFMGVEIH